MPESLLRFSELCQQHSESSSRPNVGMETIGQRIRRFRKAKGMSAKTLALSVGLRPSTLSELESGASKSTTKLHLIADALGVDVSELDPSTPKRARSVKDEQENYDDPSRAVRLNLSRLRTGYGMVANFFEARRSIFRGGEDLDLLAMAYEWTHTHDHSLLTEIDAEVESRVRKRGVERSEPAQGEVGIANEKRKRTV